MCALDGAFLQTHLLLFTAVHPVQAVLLLLSHRWLGLAVTTCPHARQVVYLFRCYQNHILVFLSPCDATACVRKLPRVCSDRCWEHPGAAQKRLVLPLISHLSIWIGHVILLTWRRNPVVTLSSTRRQPVVTYGLRPLGTTHTATAACRQSSHSTPERWFGRDACVQSMLLSDIATSAPLPPL
jgi:hypothetical protein